MIKMAIKFSIPIFITGCMIYLAWKYSPCSPIFTILGSMVMLYAITFFGKSLDKDIKKYNANKRSK